MQNCRGKTSFLRIFFFICSLRLSVFWPPLFRFLESLEKSNGNKGSHIWKLLLIKGVKLLRKKKIVFCEFCLTIRIFLASVLLFAPVERCFVSRMRDFFFRNWVFQFCHKLSFLVFFHYELCQNMSFWVVLIWVFQFGQYLSFWVVRIQVLSFVRVWELDFFQNLIDLVLLQFQFLSFVKI